MNIRTNQLRTNLLRVGLLLCATIFLGNSTTVYAQTFTTQDLRDINNERPWYDPTFEGCTTEEDTDTTLIGSENQEKAFNFFVEQGLTAEQSAGIVGNLIQEAGAKLDPKVNQAGSGPGRGIAQWSVNERWAALVLWAAAPDPVTKAPRDPLALKTQLQYIWYEMVSVPPWNQTLPAIKAATTVDQATVVFEEKFEKAGDPQMAKRIQYAKQVFAKYGGSAGSPVSPVAGDSATGCPSAISAGGVAIVDGLAFPLKTTKTTIKNNPEARWCFESQANCHHDYNAADIHAPIGTLVVAATPGIVVNIGSNPTSMSVKGNDKRSYFYQHMGAGTAKVKPGQRVTAGQPLGNVGNRQDAFGTNPHLHFDIL
ncbi:MAG: phage tail tip lysozyme, partial [Patescibacteria group bacterium]